MSENVQKSYYAIIPASVRYDERLTANAKLLYGEITALCNEKGYCWASNNYFAELYGVSKTSISKWVNSLVECGYVVSEIIYKNGTKEILNRYLRIVEYPIKEKLNTPIEEKFKDNNKDSNNTVNNTEEKKDNKKESHAEEIKEIITYFNEKTGKNYRLNNKTNSDLIIARLKDGFTVEEFKTVIDNKVEEWLNDSKMNKYLTPTTLFRASHFEDYLNSKPKKKEVKRWGGLYV